MKDYHTLSVDRVSSKNIILTMITYITEEEEKDLDKGKDIHLVRGDMTFDINSKQVYCYGSVDLTTGSDDYNLIEDSPIFNFLSFLVESGIHIPSDYVFEKHECHSPIDRIRWTETWNPARVAQYSYIPSFH